MLDYDADARRQLARERAEALARDYRRAQKAPAEAEGKARAVGLRLLAGRLRRRRLARAAL
jgi:hypothetical protein